MCLNIYLRTYAHMPTPIRCLSIHQRSRLSRKLVEQVTEMPFFIYMARKQLFMNQVSCLMLIIREPHFHLTLIFNFKGFSHFLGSDYVGQYIRVTLPKFRFAAINTLSKLPRLHTYFLKLYSVTISSNSTYFNYKYHLLYIIYAQISICGQNTCSHKYSLVLHTTLAQVITITYYNRYTADTFCEAFRKLKHYFTGNFVPLQCSNQLYYHLHTFVTTLVITTTYYQYHLTYHTCYTRTNACLSFDYHRMLSLMIPFEMRSFNSCQIPSWKAPYCFHTIPYHIH